MGFVQVLRNRALRCEIETPQVDQRKPLSTRRDKRRHAFFPERLSWRQFFSAGTGDVKADLKNAALSETAT